MKFHIVILLLIIYIKCGDTVSKGDVLGHVGPKYISPISGNKYTDSSGRQTNGATTGCHLHFSIKENGRFVNPLDFIDICNL